jgi:predicted dehydrogenase
MASSATPGATRWAILGTGGIARKFVGGLQSAEGAELVAVGSRSADSAEAFGAEFEIPNRHASYEALVGDPDVDIVYVATPHPQHHDAVLLCQSAGKAVLCEKPFTVNARDAAELIENARAKRLFLMEAMWSRYFPAMIRFRELIAEGAIGEPHLLQADFGFRTAVDPTGRLFDVTLGGGALLDVGVYVVSLASMIFGPPKAVAGIGQTGETGVDELTAITLAYAGGQIAQLTCAIRTETTVEATLFGTEGSLTIESPWFSPSRLTLARSGHDPERLDLPYVGNGYNYEAEEAGRCLREGLLESPTMPLDETLQIMRTLDRIRAPWPVRYPGDE